MKFKKSSIKVERCLTQIPQENFLKNKTSYIIFSNLKKNNTLIIRNNI